MPYYYLIEARHLSPPRPEGEGLTAARRRLGFLDFLRQLQEEDFAFAQYEPLRVDGLEDVLLAARPNLTEVSLEIHRVLQHAASDLDRKLVADVQVVFRNPLVRGDELWVEHPAEKHLLLSPIFGAPPPLELGGGGKVYQVSFNLSSNQ